MVTAYKQIKVNFAGSFQCRLATDTDPTTSSRSDPYGDLRSPASTGWTFDYNETAFDRIIRCQSPVELRSALVDPFVPVKITTIETQQQSLVPGFEFPLVTVPADPLLGLPVSLGANPVFDAAAGSGASFEKILNCVVTFGTVLTATPVSPPQITGLVGTGATAEYLFEKPPQIFAALALGRIGATRAKVLAQPMQPPAVGPPHYIQRYSAYFGYKESSKPVGVSLSAPGSVGFLAAILLSWTATPTLELTFSRFDGDTLTGHVEGCVRAVK
ncbi:hypothetical protein [Streptomyces sp. MZ04]|uniref:hypothetical protein n=1 Tax=Streptomyces sp. MZ04 TaxID=2559236 RepID=UPI00107EB2D2|nr:hypothetical protein [Streptomyces sp. MZ04]TGB02554.1 hypothetical protein E2651_26805 [Streptomyces sp. MZ04]